MWRRTLFPFVSSIIWVSNSYSHLWTPFIACWLYYHLSTIAHHCYQSYLIFRIVETFIWYHLNYSDFISHYLSVFEERATCLIFDFSIIGVIIATIIYHQIWHTSFQPGWKWLHNNCSTGSCTSGKADIKKNLWILQLLKSTGFFCMVFPFDLQWYSLSPLPHRYQFIRCGDTDFDGFHTVINFAKMDFYLESCLWDFMGTIFIYL